MWKIINQRPRKVISSRKQEEQYSLLKNYWIDFNHILINHKNIPGDAWNDDNKDFSGFINTNTDNLIS